MGPPASRQQELPQLPLHTWLRNGESSPVPLGASRGPAGRCPEAAGRTRTQRLGKEGGPETSPEPGHGAASLGPASRVSRPGAAPLDSCVPAGVISVHTWGGEHGPLPLPGGSEPGVLRPLSGQVRGAPLPSLLPGIGCFVSCLHAVLFLL